MMWIGGIYLAIGIATWLLARHELNRDKRLKQATLDTGRPYWATTAIVITGWPYVLTATIVLVIRDATKHHRNP